jgi:hypothetical protein
MLLTAGYLDADQSEGRLLRIGTDGNWESVCCLNGSPQLSMIS